MVLYQISHRLDDLYYILAAHNLHITTLSGEYIACYYVELPWTMETSQRAINTNRG
jgi:hypothetical protein